MAELLNILTEGGSRAFTSFVAALDCTDQLPLNLELLNQAKDAAVDEKIAARIEQENAARVEEKQIGGRRYSDDHHRYCSVTPGLKAMPHDHDIVDNVSHHFHTFAMPISERGDTS